MVNGGEAPLDLGEHHHLDRRDLRALGPAVGLGTALLLADGPGSRIASPLLDRERFICRHQVMRSWSPTASPAIRVGQIPSAGVVSRHLGTEAGQGNDK